MRMDVLQMKDKQRYAVLKILVEGGGCSGFSYDFDVISDEQSEKLISEMEDVLLFTHPRGMRILSDQLTMEMINGSTIEYVQEMIRSAFEVTENPMADNGCSCGVSFSPKGM